MTAQNGCTSHDTDHQLSTTTDDRLIDDRPSTTDDRL